MPKALLIVESPTKAQTIGKYLGKDFIVKSSVGHIKDLPKNKLGVNIEGEFEPEYEIIKGKKKILTEIKKAAAEVETIYLAPDPDREGEAIAWHIAEELKQQQKKIYRLLFNELTKEAILEGIKSPQKLDQYRFDAQQARRILDRLVGYQISPILWDKVRRGLSAGRVQSVAVRIISEREREIEGFVKEEYWSISASFMGDDPEGFEAMLVKIKGRKPKIKNEDKVNQITQDLKKHVYVVSQAETKERKVHPTPPFITSKLQQEAIRKLRFTAKKTMMVAQKLYEGIELGDKGLTGLITYMRTDSPRVSDSAIEQVREFIGKNYGEKLVPVKPNFYKSRKGAQGAHEAIRPTCVEFKPEDLGSYLDKDQMALYGLIWRRFVASQMTSALFDQTTIDIVVGDYLFRASGSILKFLGFMTIYQLGEERENNKLPPISSGEKLKLLGINPKQHFTQPPPRFTEAALVKELEENGIGRPSTYASILSTITDREYVDKEDGKFYPTELGFLVTDLLVENFPDILNVEFTAQMESTLDRVEDGKTTWTQTLDTFYQPFKENLEKARLEMKDIKKEGSPTDLICERCGKPLVIKWSKNGSFLSCSSYPECKNTKNFKKDSQGKIKILEEEVREDTCEKCGKPMVVKHGRFGTFLACSGYPECKSTKPLSTGIKCPEEGCDGSLVERRSRRGKIFYGCSSYPRCNYAIWDKPIKETCPECNAPFLVEKKSRKGGHSVVCLSKECGFKRTADKD